MWASITFHKIKRKVLCCDFIFFPQSLCSSLYHIKSFQNNFWHTSRFSLFSGFPGTMKCFSSGPAVYFLSILWSSLITTIGQGVQILSDLSPTPITAVFFLEDYFNKKCVQYKNTVNTLSSVIFQCGCWGERQRFWRWGCFQICIA